MQGRFKDSVGVFPEFIDGYSILILPTTGRYFQIPYGCLVPDVDNLLEISLNEPATWEYSVVRANGKDKLENYIFFN